MDIGSCWKNNENPCNGDVTSDVTRYCEMIVNPEIEPLCKSNELEQCPPYHTFSDGTRVSSNRCGKVPLMPTFSIVLRKMHCTWRNRWYHRIHIATHKFSGMRRVRWVQTPSKEMWRLGWWSKDLGTGCWKAFSITIFIRQVLMLPEFPWKHAWFKVSKTQILSSSINFGNDHWWPW